MNDGQIGWDDTIKNDTIYALFPPGVYRFEVVAMKDSYYQPKPNAKLPPCRKLDLTVRVYNDDGEYADIWHTLYMHTMREGFLCAFFKAIGQRKHGEELLPRWKEVVGSQGRCKVIIDSWAPDGHEKRERNKISEFLDPANFPPLEDRPSVVMPATTDDDPF